MIKKVDNKKLQRQLEGISKWKANKAVGTLQWC